MQVSPIVLFYFPAGVPAYMAKLAPDWIATSWSEFNSENNNKLAS